jgi:hypothetical protein
MGNQNKEIEGLKNEFRSQNIIILVAILISIVCTGILIHLNLDWDSDEGYIETISWEEKYYEMKSERDELQQKFEEVVKYCQQCEKKLNDLK